jgi:hypothetical protein
MLIVFLALIGAQTGNPALDEFIHGMQSQVLRVTILCAIGIILIGLPLYWLRLELERMLIRSIRSRRCKREAQKTRRTAAVSGSASLPELADSPHCPECNAQMVKRLARRRQFGLRVLRSLALDGRDCLPIIDCRFATGCGGVPIIRSVVGRSLEVEWSERDERHGRRSRAGSGE